MPQDQVEPANGLRRDARRNAARLRETALDVFLERGLDVPLDDIARGAGLSIGTVYNRFGSRERLIDAVLPEILGARIGAVVEATRRGATARDRLEVFVQGMIALQQEAPAFGDALQRRYPRALAVLEVCDRAVAFGHDLVQAAHEEGSLSPDFDDGDLVRLLWLAGAASRSDDAPDGWQRILERALESAWTQAS